MKAKLIEKFVSIYGEGGEIRSFFSPGRVNLIGEHTDYNGGHVFPCALSIGTYMIVRKREDRTIRFYSENFSKLGVIETSLDDLVYSEKAGWTNYPKGVMWAMEGRGYKIPTGMDIHTGRDLVSSAFHCPHNSLRIVGPSCFFRIYQIIQACLDHAQFAEVFRIETDRTVFTFADDHVSSDAQCTWENVSSVVVCMLSDQVYTPR